MTANRIGGDIDPLSTSRCSRGFLRCSCPGRGPRRPRPDAGWIVFNGRLQRGGTILVDARAPPCPGFRRRHVQLSPRWCGRASWGSRSGVTLPTVSLVIGSAVRGCITVCSCSLAREQRSAGLSCPRTSECPSLHPGFVQSARARSPSHRSATASHNLCDFLPTYPLLRGSRFTFSNCGRRP